LRDEPQRHWGTQISHTTDSIRRIGFRLVGQRRSMLRRYSWVIHVRALKSQVRPLKISEVRSAIKPPSQLA
jgi:hypothetical protein